MSEAIACAVTAGTGSSRAERRVLNMEEKKREDEQGTKTYSREREQQSITKKMMIKQNQQAEMAGTGPPEPGSEC